MTLDQFTYLPEVGIYERLSLFPRNINRLGELVKISKWFLLHLPLLFCSVGFPVICQVVFFLEQCITNVTFVQIQVKVVKNVFSSQVKIFTAPFLVLKKTIFFRKIPNFPNFRQVAYFKSPPPLHEAYWKALLALINTFSQKNHICLLKTKSIKHLYFQNQI